MKKVCCVLLLLLLFAGCRSNPQQGEFENTEKLTPTPGVRLDITVEYEAITPTGVMEVLCKTGKGIKLDLNKDGISESVYVAKEGIYINDIRQELNYGWETYENYGTSEHGQPWDAYWIVDVDTADEYLNLIFGFEQGSDDAEALTYYDGELKEAGVLSTFGGNSGFSSAEYSGAGTFVVKEREQTLMDMVFYAPVTYNLDKDGKVSQVDEFVALREPYPLTLLEKLAMYTKPDTTSATFFAEPQSVLALAASDNWIQFRLKDGTEGWINVEYVPGKGYIINQEKTSDELFEGFSNAG